MKVNIISYSGAFVEEATAKKIKTKGQDFKNIERKSREALAPKAEVEPVKEKVVEEVVKEIEKKKKNVYEQPPVENKINTYEQQQVENKILEGTRKEENTEAPHRYSFEQEPIPAWREPAENKKKSTVIDTIPNIATAESVKEQYTGILRRLSPIDDTISYTVVLNGLNAVEEKEKEKETLTATRDKGKKEYDLMVETKNRQIKELQQEYNEKIQTLEKELKSLQTNGQTYLEEMNDSVKNKELEILELYKTMKIELAKAERADAKAKEAKSLEKDSVEIAGGINPEFLKGLKTEEDPKKPVDVFASLRKEELKR